MRLKSLFALLLVTGLLISCQPDKKTPEKTPLNAAFDCSTSSQPPVFSSLYLTVNESKVKIANIQSCELLTIDQYEEFQVPEEAFAAAGQVDGATGDYFYAVREERKITIYKGRKENPAIDSSGEIRYRQIGSFYDGRFEIEIPLGSAELAGIYAKDDSLQSYILFLGLQGKDLEGKLFEVPGPLPPSNRLVQILPLFEPIQLNSLKFNEELLTFQCKKGNGRFLVEEEDIFARFNYQKEEGQEMIIMKKLR